MGEHERERELEDGMASEADASFNASSETFAAQHSIDNLFDRKLLDSRHTAVSNVNTALDAAEQIGYPVILRSAFTLGGLGSGFANNPDELRDLSANSLSVSPQVLIERSMKGWKELEYEVVRDGADNTTICCNMENFDPLGTHTGDSIVVAPSQTLLDDEYHMLRSAAIKVIRHLSVLSASVTFSMHLTPIPRNTVSLRLMLGSPALIPALSSLVDTTAEFYEGDQWVHNILVTRDFVHVVETFLTMEKTDD
ncbi:carbamoyl-phosphate synthase L chain, ATP binding domain-containing protein [Suillus subluteus]|nr:carbamoyl-phosphate synthase L chain, ATP binding domain-containing protein [Suillus subluteus]